MKHQLLFHRLQKQNNQNDVLSKSLAFCDNCLKPVSLWRKIHKLSPPPKIFAVSRHQRYKTRSLLSKYEVKLCLHRDLAQSKIFLGNYTRKLLGGLANLNLNLNLNRVPEQSSGTKSRYEVPARSSGTKSRHEVPARSPGTKSRHEIPVRSPGMKSRLLCAGCSEPPLGGKLAALRRLLRPGYFALATFHRLQPTDSKFHNRASGACTLCSAKALYTYNIRRNINIQAVLARKPVAYWQFKLQLASVRVSSTKNREGEVLKQPFLDILVTDFEQISFSNVNTTLNVKIGDQLNAGDKIGKNGTTSIVLAISGKVIQIDKKQITIQKTQPVLFYSEADIHVKSGEWVEKGCPILTLTHQTLITGDIVQGIPKIEQLFEAPGGKDSEPLSETLHLQLREIFRQHWSKFPLPQAVRRSLEEIQQILVEGIQRVYLSQGVLIADKHIEIVVRQMTSKGQILESGNTGLFIEEILPIRQIEAANLTTPGKKAIYIPAVIGLTRAALDSESFISAASFQETTRVLSRDAVIGKSDFLRGLKEKVVIGDLISAGTGLDNYFIYNILFDQGHIQADETTNFRGFTKHNLQKLANYDSKSKKKHRRHKEKI